MVRTPALTLCTLVLVLACSEAHAYRIVEGRYRVEVAPGAFQDQLVVRCDDGRQLTVAWETKLREACGESLMGGSAAAEKPAAAATVRAAAAAPAAHTDFASSEAVQKRMHLTRLKLQAGDVPEHLVSFRHGADGLAMHMAPELDAVLKQFEACRQARREDCIARRNDAYLRLRGGASASRPALAAPSAAASATGQLVSTRPQAVQPAAARAEPIRPAADPVRVRAERRANLERQIAEQFQWCLRAQPRYECEQARTRAVNGLDAPAGKGRKAGAPPKRTARAPQA